MTGLMRGDGEFSPATDDAFADLVKRGDLKVIAVMGPSRARVYPNVPSTAEQGYPEFGAEFVFQRPLFLPPKTPEAISKTLEKALMDALADPELLAWAKKIDYSIDPLSAKETTELIGNIQKTFTAYIPFLKAELAKK